MLTLLTLNCFRLYQIVIHHTIVRVRPKWRETLRVGVKDFVTTKKYDGGEGDFMYYTIKNCVTSFMDGSATLKKDVFSRRHFSEDDFQTRLFSKTSFMDDPWALIQTWGS